MNGCLAPAAAFAVLLAAPSATVVRDASAHGFYELSCCHDRDCAPIPFSEVRVTPDGYLIVGTGVLIPFSDRRIRPTPVEDEGQRYHLCTTTGTTTGMVICLYVPQGGV